VALCNGSSYAFLPCTLLDALCLPCPVLSLNPACSACPPAQQHPPAPCLAVWLRLWVTAAPTPAWARALPAALVGSAVLCPPTPVSSRQPASRLPAVSARLVVSTVLSLASAFRSTVWAETALLSLFVSTGGVFVLEVGISCACALRPASVGWGFLGFGDM
jgi:hypothetical protein